MSRKREKPEYASSQYVSSSVPNTKRACPSPSAMPPHSKSKASESRGEDPLDGVDQQETTTNTKQSSAAVVVVTGLAQGCSVLDLKSRFEIYGSISRLRIDGGGLGYITFRSMDSAAAAINASLDPSFPITVDSRKVQVSWASDPLPQWREGIRLSTNKDQPLSKLVRAEVPLRRHGRGNKLGAGAVSPRSKVDLPFKGREIIAYDDLL